MDRLFVPSLGPTDWRRLLADPTLHWVAGRSAYECSVAWEAARAEHDGLPPAVRSMLATHELTAGAELVLGLPELKVPLAGGGHQSQTDLWALLGTTNGFVSVAFEAKAGERLGDTVLTWMSGGRVSAGRDERIREIMEELGLQLGYAELLRYQLLHRAVSAIKMARRFRAHAAAMVVHSFGGTRDDSSFDDFLLFGEIMGATVRRGRLVACGARTSVPFYLGWVDDARADEFTLRAGLEASGARRRLGAGQHAGGAMPPVGLQGQLPPNVVDQLIALGERETEPAFLGRADLPARSLRELLVGDMVWEAIGQALSEEQLVFLIRGLVRFQRVGGEHAGSVSPVIALFRLFATRAPAREADMAAWIYGQRVNPYEPFGTRTVETALTWEEAREERLARIRERAVAEQRQRIERLDR